MIKVAFFDTKPYDKIWFDKMNNDTFKIKYFESKLNADTAQLVKGYEAVIAFVNDTIDKEVIDILSKNGVKVIAMRCAGYNNVDFQEAYGKINIVRVPGYSPNAVAEHAMALLLTLNRRVHRAYNRTREYNFSLNGLVGFDLYGKTVGVIGTGKIGQVFISICKGFGMKVLAYDPYPVKGQEINYVSLEEILEQSDILSLHCPLTESTYHLLNHETLSKVKDGAILINTSRGALIESEALLQALQSQKIGGACLDVYEEETDLFFEDFSNVIIKDNTLSLLLSLPNVIITSHQAFLTEEALKSIAETTINNLKAYFENKPLANEVCYYCNPAGQNPKCNKTLTGRCFFNK
jgi:D-lactate dehydrogenase